MLLVLAGMVGCKDEARPAERAPTAATAAADSIDPCTLLTDADIEQVLGKKLPMIGTAADSPVKWQPGCLWQDETILLEVHASTEGQLRAGVNATAEERYAYSKQVRPPNDEITDLSGIGDAAFWSTRTGLTILVRGKALVTVVIAGKDADDQRKAGEALGARIAARL